MRISKIAGISAVGAGLVGFTLLAHPKMPKEVEGGPEGLHQIALTFDAGGEVAGLSDLLNELTRENVQCTFFLTGKWALDHPDLAKEIVMRGHEIGNHTWSHPDLTKLSDEGVRTQIRRSDEVLSKFAGKAVKPLFRAPFGARDQRILSIIGESGYCSIYWTLDSLDSVEPPKTPGFLIDRVTKPNDSNLDGAIILMHVGEPATAAALPEILSNYRHRGFKVVTVSRLMKGRKGSL